LEERNLYLLKNLIEEFQYLHQNIVLETIPKNRELLNQFVDLRKNYRLENQAKSINLNIFNYFQPNETMHSKLLAMLLNPHGEHGQGNVFIHSFLNKLGIKYNSETDKWKVTAEIGRIDILIKSTSGHVIIIENKSNWAVDQDSQLYRYWYKEIYKPNLNKNKDPNYTLTATEKFQIVYLAPDLNKTPSEYSLKKCRLIDPGNMDGLPEKLEDHHVKKWTFKDDIVVWLEEQLPLFNQNHRLREYLLQYIELWKTN
jgi:hypothetical protein